MQYVVPPKIRDSGAGIRVHPGDRYCNYDMFSALIPFNMPFFTSCSASKE